ncbi:MAG: hypothetical protein Q7J15_00870 [Candidatus Desulfaltia sp.]|nr:hypothetical protein [Candidatus Desulfaltia sp.]
MKRLTTCLFCVLLTFFFSVNLNAATAMATPTIYKITISKMEFYSSDTATWVTVGEGDMIFDIASVNAGAVAGSYVSASAIPEGTYTRIRATLSRNITIKATDSTLGGGPYYTTVTQISDGVNTAIKASTVIADYAEGTAVIPASVSGVSGDYYIEEYDFSSSIIVKKGITKKARVKFDVTNAATFDNAMIIAYPTKPSVTIQVVD